MEVTLHYYLYPPFFVVTPQTSFDKAWEDFNLRLLSLENRTADIRRCAPPDHGIDLIWEKEGIVYQCKATEYGERINIRKIEQSIQTALSYRSILRWKRYIICTNVTLTGKQQLSLKSFLPEIEFMQQEMWINLCKKFHYAIAERFLVPVQISQERILRALNEAYLRDYQQSVTKIPSADRMILLVYSRRRDYPLELVVPSSCSVDHVLTVLQTIFNLSPAETVETNGVSIALTYTLSIDGREVSSCRQLSELGPPDLDRPIVMVWRTITWYKPSSDPIVMTDLESMMETSNGWQIAESRLLDKPIRNIVRFYEQKIEEAIDRTVSKLIEERRRNSDLTDTNI